MSLTTWSAYTPRHAAPGMLQKAAAWAARAWAWIDRKADQEMRGGALCLCGALLGLLVWPLIIWCYFG